VSPTFAGICSEFSNAALPSSHDVDSELNRHREVPGNRELTVGVSGDFTESNGLTLANREYGQVIEVQIPDLDVESSRSVGTTPVERVIGSPASA
jgi:hypothetical protein